MSCVLGNWESRVLTLNLMGPSRYFDSEKKVKILVYGHLCDIV